MIVPEWLIATPWRPAGLTPKATAINHLARANRTSPGPRLRANERVKKVRCNPKVPKVPKVRTSVEPRRLVYQVLKNSKSETSSETQETAQTYPTDNSCMDNSKCDHDWSSIGWHEGWEQTYDTTASSFSLESFDLDAMSGPKRFEWVKMNLDTGATVNTFSVELWSRWRRRWKILPNSQWVSVSLMVELGSFKVTMKLNGRLTGAHKVLCSAGEIACKGRQDFYLGSDGGFIIPVHRNIWP